jgi:hypothetical protein
MSILRTIAYLLLCLVSRTRPFGDDVLLGFSVGREGEGDTGKGGALFAKISCCATCCCLRLLTKSIPTISWAFERPSPATSETLPEGLLYIAGGP